MTGPDGELEDVATWGTSDPPRIIPAEGVGGGAFPGDFFMGRGRYRDRIYPPEDRTYSGDTEVSRGEQGLHLAITRAQEAAQFEGIQSIDGARPSHEHAAQVATYEVLEWAHSLHEYYQRLGTYEDPVELHPDVGSFVEAAIAARNASHHGLRRVVGIAAVSLPIYLATEVGDWKHTGQFTEASHPSLRWRRELPPPPLRSARLQALYADLLAGTDVRLAFRMLARFFFYLAPGREMPPYVEHVGWNAPGIDLAGWREHIRTSMGGDTADPPTEQSP